MPYAQPAAVERNIYERVCDVNYGTVQPGTPLQAPRTAMESHRAPSLQSVDSVGNGSVRSGSMTDYPRQWEPEHATSTLIGIVAVVIGMIALGIAIEQGRAAKRSDEQRERIICRMDEMAGLLRDIRDRGQPLQSP